MCAVIYKIIHGGVSLQLGRNVEDCLEDQVEEENSSYSQTNLSSVICIFPKKDTLCTGTCLWLTN